METGAFVLFMAAAAAAAAATSQRDHPPIRSHTPTLTSENGPTRRQQSALNGVPRSLNLSTPSTANSSRESSPARPSQRQKSASTAPPAGPRSRNSSDASPSRAPSLPGPSTTVPSAAAIQRALSSASIPQLQPASTSQDPSRVPRPSKSPSGTGSGDNTPHWPISPRLKSPPPNPDARSRSRRNSLRTQAKKVETSSTPSIVVQSSSPAPVSRIPIKDEAVASDPEEQTLNMKALSRGPSGVAPKLETVQEGSLPTTPGYDGLDVQMYVVMLLPTFCLRNYPHVIPVKTVLGAR